DFEEFGLGQGARPGGGIDVAADGSHGCDLRERGENFGSAYVSGVKDAVGSAQRIHGLRTQQAVSVGDYAKDRCAFRHRFQIITKRTCSADSHGILNSLSNIYE